MAGVDIYEQADMFVSELSGGQKRKLSVAIALIGNPKVWFYFHKPLWSAKGGTYLQIGWGGGDGGGRGGGDGGVGVGISSRAYLFV